MKLRATKAGECVLANTWAELLLLITDEWDVEEWVVGFGWVVA